MNNQISTSYIEKIPCRIMRGGTSKGLFFLEEDLPRDESLRDQYLLQIMGSPDINQIDGLGGSKSVTSKVAIIGRSKRADADVDYSFRQVSVDKAFVSKAGNCGNITSAVGPFAIECGMVAAREPVTEVRIYNTNTDKVIVADIACADGHVVYGGDCAIAGVPGTASPIKMRFLNPMGTLRKYDRDPSGLLPTGSCVDTFEIPGLGQIRASIVDVTNPLVFVCAKDLGMTGKESPAEIDGNRELLTRLEMIRGKAAVLLGLCEKSDEAALVTPGIPKLAIMSEPQDFTSTSGQLIKKTDMDITGRMMSMQKTHQAYALTGSMCTAASAMIPGTITNLLLGRVPENRRVRIAHPGGVLEVGVDYTADSNSRVKIIETYGFRTAKLLMSGITYYRHPGETD